jgi:hypothetical protein
VTIFCSTAGFLRPGADGASSSKLAAAAAARAHLLTLLWCSFDALLQNWQQLAVEAVTESSSSLYNISSVMSIRITSEPQIIDDLVLQLRTSDF